MERVHCMVRGSHNSGLTDLVARSSWVTGELGSVSFQLHIFAGDIRIWREMTLEQWLPLPPHICEHSLPVVPP